MVAFVGFLFLGLPGQSANATSNLVGAGLANCWLFLDQYREHGNAHRDQYMDWSLGFLTGFNFTRVPLGQPTKDLTRAQQQVYSHIGAHCTENPSDSVMEAVIDYYFTQPNVPAE